MELKPEHKEKKKRAIYEAAHKVLSDKGYKGTSMLAVAKAAKASNETMYNWFGDKQGLLADMIRANGNEIEILLEKQFPKSSASTAKDFTDTLDAIGATLLQILTNDNMVALNRAAAADASSGNVLGKLLQENCRNGISLLLADFFSQGIAAGHLVQEHPDEIAEVYLALLLGDLQIRRVTGVMKQPEEANARIHSQRVSEIILQLFSPGK